jgi:heme exporter protein D
MYYSLQNYCLLQAKGDMLIKWLTNVIGTVPMAKYTLWLGTVLRHDHVLHNVQKPEKSEQ